MKLVRFLLGLAFGAGVAVLLAPKSGRELRELLIGAASRRLLPAAPDQFPEPEHEREWGEATATAVAEPPVAAPAVEKEEPFVAEAAPPVWEPSPMVEEPAPVVEEPAPVVAEAQPTAEEPAPVVEEPLVAEPASGAAVPVAAPPVVSLGDDLRTRIEETRVALQSELAHPFTVPEPVALEEVVAEAVVAEAAAEEAVAEAVVAEAVAEEAVAEAMVAEVVAEEAVAEALVADAVAEAVVTKAIAEEAVEEAVAAPTTETAVPPAPGLTWSPIAPVVEPPTVPEPSVVAPAWATVEPPPPAMHEAPPVAAEEPPVATPVVAEEAPVVAAVSPPMPAPTWPVVEAPPPPVVAESPPIVEAPPPPVVAEAPRVVEEATPPEAESGAPREGAQIAEPHTREGGAIDQAEMRRRIEETRARLKAKAFDAMMSGEAALLSRDSGAKPVPTGEDVKLEPEIDSTIDESLSQEDY